METEKILKWMLESWQQQATQQQQAQLMQQITSQCQLQKAQHQEQQQLLQELAIQNKTQQEHPALLMRPTDVSNPKPNWTGPGGSSPWPGNTTLKNET